MESVIDKLKKVGLTEYEAKVYLALLNTHLSTATQAAEKSGVPRTKIYFVLESLKDKGWVKVYSGVPLLFKAIAPLAVFDKVKDDYAAFLESVQSTLNKEVNGMKEKFVIKKINIGIDGLKQEIAKAKTVEINNATTAFVKKSATHSPKTSSSEFSYTPAKPNLQFPKHNSKRQKSPWYP